MPPTEPDPEGLGPLDAQQLRRPCWKRAVVNMENNASLKSSDAYPSPSDSGSDSSCSSTAPSKPKVLSIYMEDDRDPFSSPGFMLLRPFPQRNRYDTDTVMSRLHLTILVQQIRAAFRGTELLFASLFQPYLAGHTDCCQGRQS